MCVGRKVCFNFPFRRFIKNVHCFIYIVCENIDYTDTNILVLTWKKNCFSEKINGKLDLIVNRTATDFNFRI